MLEGRPLLKQVAITLGRPLDMPMLAVACGMAFLAGATDVYGFFELRGLYVSFMSGNTTMLGMSLSASGHARAAGITQLIGVFVLGAAAGEVLSNVVKQFRTAMVILQFSSCSAFHLLFQTGLPSPWCQLWAPLTRP